MLAVQPGGLDGGNEELGSVSVLAGIGHGQKTRASVAKLKVLILEASTVDGLATGAVVVSEITTLDHEVLHGVLLTTIRSSVTLVSIAYLNDTVECAILVAIAVLSSSQSAEILNGLGNSLKEIGETMTDLRVHHVRTSCTYLSKETNDDSAEIFVTLLDVKVN